MAKKITEIRCVLKTGGPYTVDYVKRLKKAVENNCTLPFTFLCLTDDPLLDFCSTIPLKHGWPGWWSKIELFRPDLPRVPALYLDLDTIITGNIDKLVFLINTPAFIALRGFNHKFKKPGAENFASGIMGGSFFNYGHVYSEFCKNPSYFMNQPRENWMHGDQGFIADQIGVINIPRLQSSLSNNYIAGKRILKLHGLTSKTKIVAWSGNPRLHELEEKSNQVSPEQGALLKQLNQYWRKRYD